MARQTQESRAAQPGAPRPGGSLPLPLAVLLYGCLAPAALLVLLGALLSIELWRTPRQRGAEAAKSIVLHGQPLAWRKVQLSGVSNLSRPVAGDFDGDGEPELALLELGGSKLQVIELDGSPLFTSNLTNVGYASRVWVWDCDRDGKDELACMPGQGPLTLYNTTGTLTPASSDLGGVFFQANEGSAVGDLDGDGLKEYWGVDSAGNAVKAFGKDGSLVYDSGPVFRRPSSWLVCDLDCDGYCEMAVLADDGQVRLYGPGGPQDLGAAMGASNLQACLELDPSGQRVLLMSPASYMTAAGDVVQIPQLSIGWNPDVLNFDIDGDHQLELLYFEPWVQGGTHIFGSSYSRLVGCGLDQLDIEYEEQFRSARPTGLLSLPSSRGEQLVLYGRDFLLICP